MGWFIKDPCGIICAGFTWFLIFYAQYVGFVCVIIPTPSPLFKWFNGIVFGVLSIFAFTAHFKAMLSDPVRIIKFLIILSFGYFIYFSYCSKTFNLYF